MKTLDERIEEIVDGYGISHKGAAQCRCIGGAQSHLKINIKSLVTQVLKDVELEENTFVPHSFNEKVSAIIEKRNEGYNQAVKDQQAKHKALLGEE